MGDSKVSAAQARATAKWEKNNYDRSLIRFPKGTQERIKATGETINGFVNRLVKAELDGPQPVQATQPQPQPTTTPEGADVLQLQLSTGILHNMDGAIRCGYSSDRVQYAIRAINTQLQQDIATEKQRRARPVYPPDDFYDE